MFRHVTNRSAMARFVAQTPELQPFSTSFVLAEMETSEQDSQVYFQMVLICNYQMPPFRRLFLVPNFLEAAMLAALSTTKPKYWRNILSCDIYLIQCVYI